MKTVNIHEAKTHLSRLVDAAANGEPIIIAKAGKPVAKLVRLDSPQPMTLRRRGFMAGQISIPDDFDDMGRAEIEDMFHGGA